MRSAKSQRHFLFFKLLLHKKLEREQVVPYPIHVRTDRGVGCGYEELYVGPQWDIGGAESQVEHQVQSPVHLEYPHGRQNGHRATLQLGQFALLAQRS